MNNPDTRPEPPPATSPEDFGAPMPQRGALARRDNASNNALSGMKLVPLSPAIEEWDFEVMQGITFDGSTGGPVINTAAQAYVFAKFMAADPTLPAHCQGNVGTCLALVWKSRQWRIAPHDIAHKSYYVKARLCYESQLIHAVVERLAPLEGRLRYEIIGEGDERRIKIIGTFKNEQEPHVYTSEPLRVLRPEKSSRPGVDARAGSPLWDRKPEVQMWYDGSRDWARMFCPDVILGVYSREEMESAQIVEPEKPVISNNPIERLKALGDQGGGFEPDAIDAAIEDVAKTIEGEARTSKRSAKTDEAKEEAKPTGVVVERAVEPKVEAKPADFTDPAVAYVDEAKRVIVEFTTSGNAAGLQKWWKGQTATRKAKKLTAAMAQELLAYYTKNLNKLEGNAR